MAEAAAEAAEPAVEPPGPPAPESASPAAAVGVGEPQAAAGNPLLAAVKLERQATGLPGGDGDIGAAAVATASFQLANHAGLTRLDVDSFSDGEGDMLTAASAADAAPAPPAIGPAATCASTPDSGVAAPPRKAAAAKAKALCKAGRKAPLTKVCNVYKTRNKDNKTRIVNGSSRNEHNKI